jgi:hypothetical protein
VVCGGIIGSLLACFWEKHILKIATGLTGAYVAVRSLSLIIGGWPDENMVAEYINNGTLDLLSNEFYYYLIAVVVLTIAGIVV